MESVLVDIPNCNVGIIAEVKKWFQDSPTSHHHGVISFFSQKLFLSDSFTAIVMIIVNLTIVNDNDKPDVKKMAPYLCFMFSSVKMARSVSLQV